MRIVCYTPGVGGEGKEIEQGGREETFSPSWEARNVWIFTLALNPRRSLRGEMPPPLSRSAFSEYLWQPKMSSTMLQGQEITQSSLYMKIHHEGIGTVWVVWVKIQGLDGIGETLILAQCSWRSKPPLCRRVDGNYGCMCKEDRRMGSLMWSMLSDWVGERHNRELLATGNTIQDCAHQFSEAIQSIW